MFGYCNFRNEDVCCESVSEPAEAESTELFSWLLPDCIACCCPAAPPPPPPPLDPCTEFEAPFNILPTVTSEVFELLAVLLVPHATTAALAPPPPLPLLPVFAAPLAVD